MPTTTSARSWTAVVVAVAVRPVLWASAVGQVFRLSPTGWWRRAPYVPRPDPAYLQFRITTQYGGGDRAHPTPGAAAAAPDPHDVVEYLEWCRSLGSTPISRPARR